MPGRWNLLVRTALPALLFGRPLAAQADEVPDLDLSWIAPPECPGAWQVRKTVGRLVGHPSNGARREPLHAHAVVTPEAGGTYRLHLGTTLGDSQGERDVSGDSCTALGNSAALILALMLNPMANLADLEAPEIPAVPAPPPEAAPKDRSSHEQRSVELRRPARLALGADVATSLGALPRAGRGVGGTFAVIYEELRFEASATYWITERKTLPEGTAGGDFALITGTTNACHALDSRLFVWDLCAGVELGRLRATAFGVRVPDRASALWLGLGAGGGLTMGPWNHIALRAELFAVVPLTRPEFVLEGLGPVHQPTILVARAGLRAEVHF